MRSIDWTQVLLYGVPAYIAAIGGAIAAVLAQLNRRQLKPTNGHTIAETVEATHAAVTETATAVAEIGAASPSPAPTAKDTRMVAGP